MSHAHFIIPMLGAGTAATSGTTTGGLLMGAAVEMPDLTAARKVQQAPLGWKTRMPRRVSKNTWYFVEDNTIPDFQLHLQRFRKGHGEVRCSSPTRRLLDGSPEAQRLMIGSYGRAEAQMPNAVLVDVGSYATPELRGIRRMMDPNVQLREAVAETLAELVKASGKDLSDDQQAELVAKYARIRDRFAHLRAEFAAMEAELELMQLKLLDVFGEVE